MNFAAGATILIVDDDSEIRAYLADLVRSMGATPLEAKDGTSALEAIGAVLPDLILLDVEMPRMDGISVCRQLKSNAATVRVPVIVITSLSSPQDRVKGIEAGADDYLGKPIYIPECTARVNALLRFKKLNDALESSENVIVALAAAIEAKDVHTLGHTERVTAYAVQLGMVVGCSDDELTGLRQGGALHDIGKVAVPDFILNKPGKLTVEEFEIVKRHPMTGYNICSPMKSLAHTLPCIRWHHEKPNGLGYPDGLAGAAIPRLALILAVADVYDALTSKRSYKDALSRQRAVSILYDEAGKGGLDAVLVKAFVENVGWTPGA